MVVNRSRDRTAGTSRGIDSMKSSGRLSRSGKWPLVEVAIQRPVGIVNELAVLDPGDSGNAGGVVQSFYEVQNQLFPVAPAHEIDFGTL